MRQPILLIALSWLAACASAPQPTAEPPVSTAMPLAYAPPPASTANYGLTDSTVFDIKGGPVGDIHVAGVVQALTEVTFAPKGTDLEATMRVTDFSGSFSNSAMGTTAAATEAEIDGPAVVTVTPRGMATVTAMPKLSPLAQRVGVSASFFRRFFVRLPDRPVRPGALWVDTIRASDENAGTKAILNDIVTSRFVRDTLINGRTLALIQTTSQRTLDISGTNEGVQIAQKLSGTGSGTVLWDAGRKLLVERTEKAQLAGTFELPQMGISALPVTAQSSLHIALK